MIITSVLSLAFSMIERLFQGFQIVSLPVNLVSVLLDFLRVGAFIIGSDLVGLVFTSVFFWLTFKLTAGLVLFIWRLLPLT